MPTGAQLGTTAATTGIQLGTTLATPGIVSGAGVAAGSLAAGALTAGIGLAAGLAVMGAANIINCGTIGAIGCQKQDDTTTEGQVFNAAAAIATQAQTGQSTPQAAIAQLQSLYAQAPGLFKLSTSFTNPAGGFDCGAQSQNGAEAPTPAAEMTERNLDCGKNVSLATYIQDLIASLQSRSAPGAGGTVESALAGTGIPTWAWAAAGVIVIALVMRK